MSRSRRMVRGTGATVPPASIEDRVNVKFPRAAAAGLLVLALGEMTTSKNLPSVGWVESSAGVRVRVSSVLPFGKLAMEMFASRMHWMSGSAVDSDRLTPVRLKPEMFWRNNPSRTRSPGSAKESPSPQEFAAAAPHVPGAGQSAGTVQARPTFTPAVQAATVGPPVQVLSSARSRTMGDSSTMLARGTFLQDAAMAKKGPFATSSGSPSAFSSKLPTGSQALPMPLKLSSDCKGGSDPGRIVGL